MSADTPTTQVAAFLLCDVETDDYRVLGVFDTKEAAEAEIVRIQAHARRRRQRSFAGHPDIIVVSRSVPVPEGDVATFLADIQRRILNARDQTLGRLGLGQRTLFAGAVEVILRDVAARLQTGPSPTWAFDSDREILDHVDHLVHAYALASDAELSEDAMALKKDLLYRLNQWMIDAGWVR